MRRKIMFGLPGLLLGAFFIQALRSPFGYEELRQLCALEGDGPAAMGPWSLWRVFTTSANEYRLNVFHGWENWYDEPQGLWAFARPLPSGLFTLEHRVFGANPTGYHMTSIACYLLLLGAVYSLYRHLFDDKRLASTAIAVFAISGLYAGFDTQYVCARHIVLSATAGIFGLLAYMKHRPVIALGCFLLSAACGETVIQVAMYLIAYEVIERRRAARAFVLSIPIGCYVIGYSILGFGANFGPSNCHYIHPSLHDFHWIPAFFGNLSSLVRLLAIGPSPYETSFVEHSAVALGFLGLLGWGLVILRAPRAIWMLLLGSFLSMPPGAFGFPSGRILVVSNIGFAVAIASILQNWTASVPVRAAWVASAFHAALGVGGLYWGEEFIRTQKDAGSSVALLEAKVAADQRPIVLIGNLGQCGEVDCFQYARAQPPSIRHHTYWSLENLDCAASIVRPETNTLVLRVDDTCGLDENSYNQAETKIMSVQTHGREGVFTFAKPLEEVHLVSVRNRQPKELKLAIGDKGEV